MIPGIQFTTTGTLAEYAIASASHAVSLPDGLSYDQAARKFYFSPKSILSAL